MPQEEELVDGARECYAEVNDLCFYVAEVGFLF